MIRSGLVSLSLFAFAASANAECAWVLWQSTEHSGPGSPTTPKVHKEWKVVRSHPSYPVCEKILEATWRVEVDHWKESRGFKWGEKAVGFYFLNFGSAGSDTWWSQEVGYSFLPDTVDPRGPKGK